MVVWWPAQVASTWLAFATMAATVQATAQEPAHHVPGALSGMRAYLRNALVNLRADDLAALAALPDSSLTWMPVGMEESLGFAFHRAVTEPSVLVRQGLGAGLLEFPELKPPLRSSLAATIDSVFSFLLGSLEALPDDALYTQMFRITRPESDPYHFYAQSVPGWQVFLRAIGWGLYRRGVLRGYLDLSGDTAPRWRLR